MDALTSWLNAWTCAVLAIIFGWAVLSPRVHDGVIIKAGLISMALGFAATAWALADGQSCDDLHVLGRAEMLIHGGLLVVMFGFALRTRGGREKRRRVTDWGDLDDSASYRGKT